MNYRDYNDYELLYMIKEENETAYEILEKKYEPMIVKIAKYYGKYSLYNGTELVDFVQEGKIGLFNAIDNYYDEGASFFTFANRCISNQIGKLNRDFFLKKNEILNNAMENNYYIDKLGISLENINIDNTQYKSNIFIQYKEFLNDLEFKIIILKSFGYNMEEIGTICNLGKSKVAYRYKTIKKKLNEIMKKY